jgi:selenocysteine lyase/cysteine desulfurase
MLDPTPYRQLFPLVERWICLNHAGVSPLSTRVAAAIRDFTDRMVAEPFTAIRADALATLVDLRKRLAALINARSVDEIALMPNTATGINTAALSLPLRPGDNVLVLDGDYPANIYPWMNLAHRGVLTKLIPARNGGLDLDLLASRMDSRTRVVAMSTVVFATGFRNDLTAVGKLCRERNVYFVVDGIQSLGALPFDVQAANVDFLACGSQKWLLGPPGAGFLYVRRELLADLAPGAYAGTNSVVDAENFLDYNFTLLPTAERFHIGSQNFAGMIGLHASVGLIQEIGVERIAERVLALAGTAVGALQESGRRVVVAAPEARSGIVIVEDDNPAASCERLNAAGVIAVPRGRGLRFAPHFYNTEAEILHAVEALNER